MEMPHNAANLSQRERVHSPVQVRIIANSESLGYTGTTGEVDMGKIDARSATAADFDRAAQRHANAFWVWLILTGVSAFFLLWLAILPAAIAVYSIIASISSTRAADQLRNGTYRILNENNGAPDGDAKNFATDEERFEQFAETALRDLAPAREPSEASPATKDTATDIVSPNPGNARELSETSTPPLCAPEFLADGRAVITAPEGADAGSLNYSLAHIFRRDLARRAKRGVKRSQTDLRVAERWAGVKDEYWTEAADDKFARGFLRYLREGRSPNAQLRSAFDSASANVGSGIDVEITPEMRKVYDNLLTKDASESSGPTQ